MLSLILSFLVGAFPLRGSVVQSIDSNLVLDQDTLHATRMCTLGSCSSCGYGFRELQDPAKAGRLDKAAASVPWWFTWVGWSTASALSPSLQCKAQVDALPDSLRRQVFRGKRAWAIWADTLKYTRTSSGMVARIGDTVLVRWRWSAIDPTLPWVRWIDTIPLDNLGKPPVGLPLLTAIKPVSIDSIAPKSRKLSGGGCAEGLSLAAKIDSTHSWNLGYGSDSCNSLPRYAHATGALPAGATLRVQDGSLDVPETAVWQLWSGVEALDGLLMIRHPSLSASQHSGSKVPLRMGLQGVDLATGRRIRLARALPIGRRVLMEDGVPRMIMVD